MTMADADPTRHQSHDDNAFFKRMVDLVPAHFYFDQEAKDKLSGRTEDASPVRKRFGEEELSDKARWKRMKLDPSQAHHVTKMQERLMEQDEIEKAAELQKKKKKKKKKIKGGEDDDELKSSTDTMDEMRKKLHAKIDEMKAKRKVLGKEEWLKKKRMRRRESKMKLKMRRKAEKHHKDKDMNGVVSPRSKAPVPAKPIYNKDGKMVFSKFDFSDSGVKEKSETSVGKDYKKLLEKVKRQKDKIQKAKEKDEELGKNLAEKAQWDKVLKKAEGVKVRDDPELLKKAIKRKEKIKEKHKKNWGERDQKVKNKMQAQQDKRKKNIQKKKQGRIDKKIKKSKKKGHIIPGF